MKTQTKEPMTIYLFFSTFQQEKHKHNQNLIFKEAVSGEHSSSSNRILNQKVEFLRKEKKKKENTDSDLDFKKEKESDKITRYCI